jgi:glycosyltransferase involved in cell wall biosynthesis
MRFKARQRVAWFSFFPVEWLEGVPAEVAGLPKEHPATWQRSLLEQLESQSKYEIHVVVLKRHLSRNLSFVRRNVHFHLVKTVGGLRAPSMFWLDTILIRRKLKSIRPDLLHAWGTERGAALVASRIACPAVVTVQGLMRWMNQLVPPSRYQRLLAWLEHRSLRRSRVATAESTFSVNYLRNEYPHLDVHHVDLAPDPIFHRLQRHPVTNPPRLLFNGELGFAKGGDLLLLALDGLLRRIDFRLVVIGSMREKFRQDIARRVSPEIWNHISFRTNLQPPEVGHELEKSCLFICPTRADTGPLALKEAVVAGVPVIASAIGGPLDYVQPGENGFLFRPGDSLDLLRCIEASLAHPVFSHGMVCLDSLARKRASLLPAVMADKFLKVYGAAWRSSALGCTDE